MHTGKRWTAWLFPSVADALFLSLLLFLAFSAGGRLLGDGDTGYHIRAGEYILQTGTVPRADLFSFTTPPLPWTAHEWLAEVLMAKIHAGTGLTGIVLFFTALIALTYYALFRVYRSYGTNLLLTVPVALLVVAAGQIHWLARPHIFSLGLTALWYHLLERYQQSGERRLLYPLPLLMLLWVNLHGGYILAFVLLGIYFLGELLRAITAAEGEKELPRQRYRGLFLVGLACLAATLANPTGYHILLFPFKLVGNQYLVDNVAEFLPPNFHQFHPYKYLLYLLLGLCALSRLRLSLTEALLAVLFTHMALYSARYIPLTAIITAPIILRQAQGLLDEQKGRLAAFLRQRSDSLGGIDLAARGCLWPLVGLLTVAVLAGNGTLKYGFDTTSKPVAAVEFLQREKLSGNMFNNDEFGDYLIYAAWPQYRVYFDGRSDMYGTARMKEYFSVINFRPGWQEILARHRIDWVFYNTDSTLTRYLLDRPDWKLVYADKVACIFVRDLPAYRDVVRRHPGVRPPPPEPEQEPK